VDLGIRKCPHGNSLLEWPYDSHAIARLLLTSKRQNVECPRCGATISLKYKTCGYCELNLTELLQSKPEIEKF